MSDLCRRRYTGVCRGNVNVTDLCRRSHFGVCKSCFCVTFKSVKKSVLQECRVRTVK